MRKNIRPNTRTDMDRTGLLVLLNAFNLNNSNTQTFLHFYSTTKSGIEINMEIPFVLSGQAMMNDQIEGYRTGSINSSYINFPYNKSLECNILYDYEEGEGKVYFDGFTIRFANISAEYFFNIIDELPQLVAERKRNRAKLYQDMAEANNRLPKEIWESIDNMMEK